MFIYYFEGNTGYDYATLQSIGSFSFEVGQDKPGVNFWFMNFGMICRADDGSKDPSNPNNCPVFIYNAHRPSS